MRTTEVSQVLRRLATQGHLIGDTWRASDGAGSYDHRYAPTGQVQAEVGLAGADDVESAVSAARAAQGAWAGLRPVKRGAILFTLADLLERDGAEAAELAALDNGTPVRVMNPGVYAAAWVRYYAGWCDKLDGEMLSGEPGLSYVRLEPYGVVAVIPPWNGSMMGMGQKCGPALAAGNAVVAKPPEVAPFGMLRFAELALEAGVPPGVLNVVVGGGATGSALVEHPGVDKISFTGGTDTARVLMTAAARNLTPLALELGGKSPNIVFADADLDAAAFGVTIPSVYTFNAGQACVAGSRILVERPILDEMIGRIRKIAESLVIGDPLQTSSQMGPLISQEQYDKVVHYLEIGKKEAELIFGGRHGAEVVPSMPRGYWVEPTLFITEDNTIQICREEIFGPVATIIPFDTDDQAVAIANDSRYGLASGVWTRDLARVHRMIRDIQSGNVWVNTYMQTRHELPFGGIKESGYGHDSILEYTREKAAVIAVAPATELATATPVPMPLTD